MTATQGLAALAGDAPAQDDDVQRALTELEGLTQAMLGISLSGTHRHARGRHGDLPH